MVAWFSSRAGISVYISWIYMASFFAVFASDGGLATDIFRRKDASTKKDSNSIPLTGSTFDLITQKGTWLVKFYAPWCPHCQKLAPFWDKLSINFNADAEENDFHFGEVNCDVELDLQKKYEVHGYPTILLFQNGKKVEEYNGATNSDLELRPFISEKIVQYKPSVIKEKPKVFDFTKLSQENLNELSAPLCQRTFAAALSTGWNFVKFSTQDCPFCAETEPIWYQLASENPDFRLSHVDCTIEQALCKKESIESSPLFKLFNNGEVAYIYPNDGDRAIEAFKEFIESSMLANPTTEAVESKPESALDTWTSEPIDSSKKSMKFRDMTSVLAKSNFTRTTNQGIWFVLFLNDASSDDTFEFAFYHLSSEFTDLHQRYGIRFALVNCTSEAELCKEKDSTASSSIQVFHLGQHVEKFANPKSYELVKSYIREQIYNIKKALRFPLHHFASQRSPNPDGKLMVLTDGVFDLDGPWFVFFKSSRCPECRVLESDWEKLATQSKDSLNVAMVQCSTEEALCKRLDISTYPYLRFFKNGVVRDYNGPVDMESLTSFASLASRPHVHTVTKDTFPNIQRREASYFLYTYNDDKDLEALEPIVKGKYFLLDIYAIPAKEYEDTSIVPKDLPHLQVFHNDVSTSSFSGDISNPILVQDWLANVQYNNVTSLDLANFDLVMEQYELIVLAVIDPLKDSPAVDSFTASSIAYKSHGIQKKPLFALLDGVKWHEYVDRVYHKSTNDLPFVAIVDSRQNIFKMSSKEGEPLPFSGEVLFHELDQPASPSIPKPDLHYSLSPTTYMLLFFLSGLAFFLFVSYRQRLFKKRAAFNQDYDHIHNQE